MCKFKEIGGKNTFSSTNYFFLLRLCFFLSRPLFSISTSLFIHAQFFSPSATFSKPAPYSQSANFYCIFWWTARWPLKKTTLWLCFSAVILICVSFPLDCHCVLPDYLQMYIGASKLKIWIAHFSQGKTWFCRGTISLVKNHKNIRVLRASDLLNAMRFFFSFLFFFFCLLTRLHTPKIFSGFGFTKRTRQFKCYMSVPT